MNISRRLNALNQALCVQGRDANRRCLSQLGPSSSRCCVAVEMALVLEASIELFG